MSAMGRTEMTIPGEEDVVRVEEPQPSTPATIVQTTKASWLVAWYHITVSIFSASTTAAMPFAFAYLGWKGGPAMLVAVAVASFYAGTLLIVKLQNRHQKTYADIADSVMGRGFSNRFIRPFQAANFFLCAVLILLVTGKSLLALQEIIGSSDSTTLPLAVWILVGGIALFVLALIPSIAELWEVSFSGTLAGTIATVLMLVGDVIAIGNGSRDNIDYGHPEPLSNNDDQPAISFAFGVLNSFGIALLGFSGHGIFPDIQASLQGSDEGETANVLRTMIQGLCAAYAVIFPCQLVCGAMGYAAFGSSVSGFVVDDLRYHVSDGFLIPIYILLIINQLSVGSIYMQAAFTLIKDLFPLLVTSRNTDRAGFYISFKELLSRFGFVAVAIFTSAAIPFFGHLAGLTGAVGYTPFSLIYPFIFWNKASRKDHSCPPSRRRIVLHTVLAVSFCLIVIGAIAGALYSIIQEASTYRFFS